MLDHLIFVDLNIIASVAYESTQIAIGLIVENRLHSIPRAVCMFDPFCQRCIATSAMEHVLARMIQQVFDPIVSLHCFELLAEEAHSVNFVVDFNKFIQLLTHSSCYFWRNSSNEHFGVWMLSGIVVGETFVGAATQKAYGFVQKITVKYFLIIIFWDAGWFNLESGSRCCFREFGIQL